MISIVIPTFRESRETVDKCIDSLRKQNYTEFEIIIVDSSGNQPTRNGVRKVHEKQRGVSIARNTGAKKSKGEVVAFIDSDTLAPADWLDEIEKRFREKGVVALGGSLEPVESSAVNTVMFRLSSNYFPRIVKAVLGFNAFHGSNMAVNRKAFLEAGGFDEKLNTIEDNELVNRMKRYGKTVFDEKIVVRTSARRFEKYGYARELFEYAKAYFLVYIMKKQPGEYKLAR